MSQLETTLRRAITDLDPLDRDGRRIALGNVRAAMVRLLAVYDPPLSAAAIEAKIDEVDGLIRTIEAEFTQALVAQAPEWTPEPEPSLGHPLADSDFEDEYEAGDEYLADEAYDEGPFGERRFHADASDDSGKELADADEFAPEFVPDALDEAVDDGVDRDVAPLRSGFGSARSLALVGGALVVLLVLLLGLLYLAGPKQFGADQSEAAAALSDPGTPAVANPNAPAAAAGTDALEATDAEPEATTAAPAAGTAPSGNPAPAMPSAPTASSGAATQPAAAPAVTVAPPPGPIAAESLVLFDGHDPSAFKSPPDNPVQFEGGTNGGSVLISSSASSNGARLVVGPGVYQRIAGRTVRIVVVARGARENPAASLRLAYQNGRQLSGWSDLALGDQYQSLAMTWAVPKQRSGAEGDAVLIEPGIPGDGTAAQISAVTIDILP